MRLAPIVYLLIAAVPASAIAQAEAETVALTAVVDAPPALRSGLEVGVRDHELPVEITTAELPHATVGEPADSRFLDALIAARRAYISAEFETCLSDLSDDATLSSRLAAGERALVARALFWRVACRVGAGDEGGARREAARFAALGLDVPSDADAATPDVEAVLAGALRSVEAAPRARCRITASVRGAVSVDGRRPGCQTPCTVDLPPGDHVVRVSADGFVPSWELARVTADGVEVEVALEQASPELAAQQWAERWTGRTDVDSTASVALLARAIRARRLLLLRGEPEHQGIRLTGVLAVDGRVAARASRSDADAPTAARELLRDLLVEGGAMEPAPGVIESPWLWIAVGLAAAAAAGLTAGLLYQPDVRTEVGF